MKRKSHRYRSLSDRPPIYRRVEFLVVAATGLFVLLLIPLILMPDSVRQWWGGSQENLSSSSGQEVSSRRQQAREKIAQGIRLNQLEMYDVAADCFRQALDLAPDEHESHYWLMLYHEERARAAHHVGRDADMIKHVMMAGLHARQLVPHLPKMKSLDRDFVLEALYNASKGALLIDEKPLALATLKLAVEQGYADREEIEGESIFDAVRQLPEFQQILQHIKPR